jgi:mitogen-activated protein kinase 1/3
VIDPEYDLDAIKGFGTYSMVCSGRNNVTNQLVAIKRIHNVFEELGDTKRILREIKILSTPPLI